MLDKNRVGLTTGLFAALLHAVWSILVFAGVAQYLSDKAISLHMIRMAHEILMFNALKAVLLVATAFVLGYVAGWLFSALYNKLGK